MTAHDVITSTNPTNKNRTSVEARYVTSRNVVLFDVSQRKPGSANSDYICSNLTVEAVEQLRDTLTLILEEAKQYERKTTASKTVEFQGKTYIFPADVEVDGLSPTQMQYTANLIVENGKVIKNRNGVQEPW